MGKVVVELMKSYPLLQSHMTSSAQKIRSAERNQPKHENNISSVGESGFCIG